MSFDSNAQQNEQLRSGGCEAHFPGDGALNGCDTSPVVLARPFHESYSV